MFALLLVFAFLLVFALLRRVGTIVPHHLLAAAKKLCNRVNLDNLLPLWYTPCN